MLKLDKKTAVDLEAGASFLGCAGGGTAYIGRLVVEEVLKQGLDISIIHANALQEDAVVIAVGNVGTTAVSNEIFQDPRTGIKAVRALEAYSGKQASALIPLEIGGGNAMTPMYLGGLMQLPIVDGDGMGRAFPQIDMVTFDIYNDYETYAAVADIYGNTQIFRAKTQALLEKAVRSAVIEVGSTVYMAQYAMTKAQTLRTYVPETVTMAIKLGHFINAARHDLEKYHDICHFFTETYYKAAKVLFEGKIVDVVQDNTQGFNIGHILIERSAQQAKIIFQNENLFFELGNVKVTVPDLIVVLDFDTAFPLFSNEYAYGQRVCVICVSAPDILATEKALKRLGPQVFGLAEEYKPCFPES